MKAKLTKNAKPRILQVSVKWNHDWDNRPQWEIVFSGDPDYSQFLFEERQGYMLGFCGDIAEFKSYDGENGQGYGGSSFTFKLKNGKTKTWKGPWSSRSSVVNGIFPNTPVVECIQIFPDKNYHRVSTAVSVLALQKFLQERRNTNDGIGLVLVENGNTKERYYEPTWFGNLKPSRFGETNTIIETLVDSGARYDEKQ